jgi:hypothetical protein
LGRAGYFLNRQLTINPSSNMKFELSTLLLGLVATAHGNGFAKTCKDIKISGSTLSAKCGDGKGGWPKSTLNLNHMFTSNDGAMTVCRDYPHNLKAPFN